MTPPQHLQKELARKLIWAVNSTLGTPQYGKKRVRAWAWALAGKMLDAKRQISYEKKVEKSFSSRYPGMAGGGAAAGSKPRPPRPLKREDQDGVSSTTSSQHGLALCGPPSPSCRGFHQETSRCDRRDCWWSGPGGLWRPTGIDDWRGWVRWWSDATQTQATRIDRRRYADDVDDRVRSLQKGCRELHIAAHTALVEAHPWQQPRSTTSAVGTKGRAASS